MFMIICAKNEVNMLMVRSKTTDLFFFFLIVVLFFAQMVMPLALHLARGIVALAAELLESLALGLGDQVCEQQTNEHEQGKDLQQHGDTGVGTSLVL